MILNAALQMLSFKGNCKNYKFQVFFSRFVTIVLPFVMEIKTHPPSDAAGMRSSISEVLRVNFDCNKRTIKPRKPCNIEYPKRCVASGRDYNCLKI